MLSGEQAHRCHHLSHGAHMDRTALDPHHIHIHQEAGLDRRTSGMVIWAAHHHLRLGGLGHPMAGGPGQGRHHHGLVGALGHTMQHRHTAVLVLLHQPVLGV